MYQNETYLQKDNIKDFYTSDGIWHFGMQGYLGIILYLESGNSFRLFL